MNQIYVQLVECKQVLCCADEFFEMRQETEVYPKSSHMNSALKLSAKEVRLS